MAVRTELRTMRGNAHGYRFLTPGIRDCRKKARAGKPGMERYARALITSCDVPCVLTRGWIVCLRTTEQADIMERM